MLFVGMRRFPCIHSAVTGVGILGFPTIEIERKLQKKFQTNFLKLMPEHKGGSTEESRVLQTGLGVGSAWLLL